ncbi:hypothetical protein [Pseudostreptobacillus hongkongensis]|uniref:hypothetical protein n=1 Tax=Pseudostreptobacillus hongkongensis TaxID=1162717 RepID=UPI000AA0E53F|nr:hypothetical protein [Pseudostreptobacillus hongkongensis]
MISLEVLEKHFNEIQTKLNQLSVSENVDKEILIDIIKQQTELLKLITQFKRC